MAAVFDDANYKLKSAKADLLSSELSVKRTEPHLA
jgi:hypothetical protein